MNSTAPQPLDYRAIDVDNHYYEPTDSFTRHLPKEFKRRGVQMLTEGKRTFAVMGGVALGLLLVALDAFRVGALVIGLALLGGAVLRWALPSVGMLAVRSRFTDMATYEVLGFVIVVLAMMVQPKPWIHIPFLDDIVHFTVR